MKLISIVNISRDLRTFSYRGIIVYGLIIKNNKGKKIRFYSTHNLRNNIIDSSNFKLVRTYIDNQFITALDPFSGIEITKAKNY